MSDGPHRSLPMRPDWRKFAEYANNKNFARDQVRDAVVAAVEKDFGRAAGVGGKQTSVEPRMFLAQPVSGSAFERCEEETGASAGPAQKRMENFMASPGPDSFVAKWIDEARS